MIDDDLPLLDLFLALRGADFQLGIAEYRDFLHALQLGFGVANKKELKFVCQALWVKTDDEQRRFDIYFKRMVKEDESFEPDLIQKPSSSTAAQPLPTVPAADNVNLPVSVSPPSVPAETGPAPTSRESEIGHNLEAVDMEALRGELVQRLASGHALAKIPRRFILTTDYYPVSSREMKQNWRYLRRMVREGLKVELDIEETVRKIGREGVLLEPVLVPTRMNRVELLLIVDRGGSMVPFHQLGRELVNTAQRGSRLGHAGIYYFHNVPVEYLYSDPSVVEAKKIDDLLSKLHRDRTVVLIFSDGGAARGGYNTERIELTQKFLDQIRGKVRRTVWLNPMPRVRWEGTSAADIVHQVPMFEFTRRGMQNAIDVLRGRYAPIAKRSL